MERTEIIITTEKVKMSEMNDREKTIFQAGYEDGLKDGEDSKWRMITSIVVMVIVVVFFIAFIVSAR